MNRHLPPNLDVRKLEIEPISMNQLKESLHILTKNLGAGSFTDGILLIVFCNNSSEIEDAKQIATSLLSQSQYQQVVIAIPKEPVQLFASLKRFVFNLSHGWVDANESHVPRNFLRRLAGVDEESIFVVAAVGGGAAIGRHIGWGV